MSIKMYDGDDGLFLQACKIAGVEPTKRHYRKYTKGKGKAFKAIPRVEDRSLRPLDLDTLAGLDAALDVA